MNLRPTELEQSEPLRTPVISLLNGQLPLALVKGRNPLFDRQLWLLHWPEIWLSRLPSSVSISDFIRLSTAEAINRYTVRYALLFPVALAFFPSCCLLSAYPSFRSMLQYYELGFLGTLGLSLLCDFYYTVTAVNGIIHQMNTGQWESLRLTMLSDNDILMANYATAQIRAWRPVIIEIGVRITLCVSLFIGYSTATRLTQDTLLSVLVGIGYILEPLWRMRTVTLIGMTMTAWMNNYATAVMVSFAALVVLLLLQVGVFYGVVSAVNVILSNAHYYRDYIDIYNVALAGIASLVGAIYLYFRAVQRVLFGVLRRVAFRG
jgi:hypothetical protein